MNKRTSDALKLYGTEATLEPMRSLTAGPLSCMFDQGALRFIKIHGKEAIRNIDFSVRDKDWGTYQPVLGNIQINQNEDSFSVNFDAVYKDEQQEIRYKATISGSADGTLSFIGDYTASTDFLTNRTGFVVLHPINGVAGQPVEFESVSGEIEQARFPELIDPVQPFKNIRALTHEVLPGLSVCCRMTGDAFEMEDHRQWNDASYKTYARPIGLPWPFTIPKSESGQQSVTLTVTGSPKKSTNQSAGSRSKRCLVEIGNALDGVRMPQIGLGLEPQHINSAQNHQDLLMELAPQRLVVWHELSKHNSDHLEGAAKLGSTISADIELQAVIPDKDYQAEVAELSAQCKAAGLELSAITVSPASYLGSHMPGPNWPDVTPLAALYDEARKQFPGVLVGGGMLSFFTELNRHRPPTDSIDFITHASNTITHASDDISVTENLEAIPHIIKSCRAFNDDKPYHVGPSSLAMRFNPYGSKNMDNPNNERIAMARLDPRQRGLLNAAWTAGYVAHMSRGGVDCVNLHAPTGEFGIINHPEDWSQPGYDNTAKQVFPAFHVVAGFAKAAGRIQLSTRSSMSREVEVVAYEENGKQIVWLANLTSDNQNLDIHGLKSDDGNIATLSVDTFDHCTDKAQGFEETTREGNLKKHTLGPYSVIRLTSS